MDYDPTQLVPEKVSKAVHDGLEQIRQTGEVDMEDRAMVWSAAMEMGLRDTARWVEGVSTHLYEVLTRMGYIVLDDRAEVANYGDDDEPKPELYDIVLSLGQFASLAVVESYAAEEMGRLGNPTQRALATHERNRLIQNLAEASALWLQLEETATDVERGIETVEAMIDPDNY